MENQKDIFLFDTKQKTCIHAGEAEETDSENLLPLPEWTPVHGFKLMEEFTGTVKNPVIRKKLRETISTRAGVFKRFRQVLAEYPEFESAWRIFKKERLKKTVYSWYQTISLAKELSELGKEPEETYEILRNDFIFSFCRPSPDFLDNLRTVLSGKDGGPAEKDNPEPEEIIIEGFSEVIERTPELFRQAASGLFYRFVSGNPGNMEIFYAETPASEKAGAVLTESFYGEDKKGRKIQVVTAAAVKKEFRGMGVFSQLLETVKNSAEGHGGKAVCFMPFTSPFLLPLLKRLGMPADLPTEPDEDIFL